MSLSTLSKSNACVIGNVHAGKSALISTLIAVLSNDQPLNALAAPIGRNISVGTTYLKKYDHARLPFTLVDTCGLEIGPENLNIIVEMLRHIRTGLKDRTSLIVEHGKQPEFEQDSFVERTNEISRFIVVIEATDFFCKNPNLWNRVFGPTYNFGDHNGRLGPLSELCRILEDEFRATSAIVVVTKMDECPSNLPKALLEEAVNAYFLGTRVVYMQNFPDLNTARQRRNSPDMINNVNYFVDLVQTEM